MNIRRSLAVLILGIGVAGPARTANAQCGKAFEIAMGTPRDTIARMVVDRMYAGIALNGTQHRNAIEIVSKAIGDLSALDQKKPDFQQKYDAIVKERNRKLVRVLPKKLDQDKLNVCLLEMQRPGPRR